MSSAGYDTHRDISTKLNGSLVVALAQRCQGFSIDGQLLAVNAPGNRRSRKRGSDGTETEAAAAAARVGLALEADG